MRDVELFQAVLGLGEPCRVVGSSLAADQRRLGLRIDFERGARFACPECGVAGCGVHDSIECTWRHLDFF
ncbi:MAG: hypothetical protein H0U79_07910 [Solirubrobacterales bacterium]|nr:hypothetical protein [Solirubrobacterales bacterium]